MNNTELNCILDNHKKWCNGECGGQRANLQGANLQRADLRWANLQRADLQEADLQGANLQRADLRWADLRWADLDFSVWPLWCGSKQVKVDKRIASQLAAHFCALDCADKDYIKARDAILEFAQSSHIAKDLEV